MYFCICYYTSSPPIGAFGALISWFNPCSGCLFLRDPLLGQMLLLLSVSQGLQGWEGLRVEWNLQITVSDGGLCSYLPAEGLVQLKDWLLSPLSAL